MKFYTYRYAKRSDLTRIVEIYNESIPSRIVTADLEPVSEESRVDWFLHHNQFSHPLWVFEDNHNSVIAWASFQAFYKRRAYDKTVEISIYIANEVQRIGIGTSILHFCESEAKQRGLCTLLAFIFKCNSGSLRLFENSGFSTWGEFPQIADMEDHFEDLIILGKQICD